MATRRKLTYGSYEVLQNPDGSPWALGAGSYGITYKARHVLLDRTNALKVIGEDLLKRGNGQDPEAGNRFLSEVRAVGNLQHPGIAMVYDCGLDKGFFYFALEYCDGGTLHQWCEQHGPMPWPEVRQIALQVASAMDYAHTNGFLHQDVKPANILLDGSGPARQAKLIDFGLATNFLRDSAASESAGHTGQEHFRGNCATLSPEQLLEQSLDARSDLFSLGITLWWLLVGHNPFAGVKRGALIAERTSPASYAAELPGESASPVRELLESLVEKDPARRIASARELIDRLDAIPAGGNPPHGGAPAVPLVPLAAPPDYEVGYQHAGALATANQAKWYSGTQRATQRPVVAIIPLPSLAPDALAGLRVAASRKLDFGVYALLDWCLLGNDDVFVVSVPAGCSLLAILRKFGPARLADAMPLLARLARCFDASRAWTTFGIQMDPREILLHTRAGEPALEHFHGWSDVDPHTARCLPLFAAAADQGTSNESTLSSSALEFPPLVQFAALVYRVLAGSVVRYAAFFTTNGYVMASGLSENGNALLARTLSAPESQSSACEFLLELAHAEALKVAAPAPLFDPPTALEIATGKLPPVAAADPPLARAGVADALPTATRIRMLGTAAPGAGEFANSAGRYDEGRKVFGGRFVLKRKLGQGGMGQVWLAADTELAGCDVALKFTAPELAGDTKAVADLRRAVTLGRELTHPKIIRIHDFHADDHEAAVSLEYMPGLNLSEWQAQSPNGFFEVRDIRDLVAQVCEALDYAHQVAKRSHRDIKPRNIMLDPATGTVKLADFDIGRRLTDTFSRNTGKEPSGSLPYMGPQQLLGENSREQDDIYSLGATIYELLTGTPPFYMGDLREQIKCAVPPDMASRRRDLLDQRANAGPGEPIPPAWEAVVAACLAKARDQRPASGAEVMACLAAPTAVTPAPQAVQPSAPLPAVATPAGGNTRQPGLAALILAGCGALGLVACGLLAWAVVKHRGQNERAAGDGREASRPSPVASTEPATAPVAKPPDVRKEPAKVPPVVRDEPGQVPPVVRKDPPPASRSLAESGVREWRPLAESGDAMAQALMARACMGGLFGAGLDVAEARRWAAKSAAQNHPLGLNLAGTLSEDDPALPPDERRRIANDQYLKAVAAGFMEKAEAGGKQWIERAGHAYLKGCGVAKDERLGVKMLQLAAGLNDPAAINNLGVCYLAGTGVAKDEKMALECYLKAADLKVASAMGNLGSCYEHGTGVEKNAVDAATWYRKAAELNEPNAMRCLGWCFERGFGVSANRKLAAEWYRKAADLGDPAAMTWFGNCCANGFGVAKDDKMAAAWFRRAADLHQTLAMRNLGWCYAMGLGVRADKKIAVEWYRKAAAGLDTQAMVLLGGCYETAAGVPKDEKAAAAWYLKAAELNNPIAMRGLGLCYLRGAGVVKDPVEAARLFRRGSELNDPVCMTNLGYCFEKGAGVMRDFDEALRWYRKAAALNEPMAMNNLGAWYEHGTGMSLGDDVKMAVEWYRKAAALGNENAKAALKRLGK